MLCLFLEQFRKLCPKGKGYVTVNGVIEGTLFIIFLYYMFKLLFVIFIINYDDCNIAINDNYNDLSPDINECMMDPTLCENGICINTDGNFRCECQEGFKIDSTGTKCIGEFM